MIETGMKSVGTMRRDPALAGCSDLQLVARAQAGDVAARNELIARNMGLIVSVVLRLLRPREDPEDMLGVAVEGYMKAVANFNPALGFALSTYSVTCIRNQILNSRRDFQHDLPILVPMAAWDRATTAGDAERVTRARSMSEPVRGRGPKVGTLGDFVAGASDIDAPERREAMAWLGVWMDQAEPRMAYVLRRRIEGRTLVEVGAEIGLSRQMVLNIERAAIKDAREWLGSEDGEPLVEEAA